MSISKVSPMVVIFLTVFIDLLGFGIVLPLLPRYATFLQTGKISSPDASPEGTRVRAATYGTFVPMSTPDADPSGKRPKLSHAQNLVIGMLMASFSAMQFLFAPLWGRLSDRMGRRPVLIIGLFSSAFFYAVFGYATWVRSLSLLFVSRIGAGIAGATIPTAQAFIADSTSDAERGRGMAMIGAAFGIGFTFGPLLGSIWVSSDPSAPPSVAPGLVASGLSFIAFCLAVAILPESLRPGSASASRRWLDIGALRSALRVPSIALLLAIFFIATFAFSNFEATLSRLTASEGFHFSDRHNFYLFAYIGILLSLFQGLFVRRMMPRLGELTLTVLGALLMTVGLAGLAFCAWDESTWTLLAVLPVAVLGFAALTPSVQSLISLRSDPGIQGGILGLSQSVSALARILGPLLGNFVFEFPPSHTLPYVVGAAFMGVAFLLSLWHSAE